MSANRNDLMEAHLVLEWDYNEGGMLKERPANQRRLESTGVQLARMGFRHGPDLCFRTLSRNAKRIYRALEAKYGLRADTGA